MNNSVHTHVHLRIPQTCWLHSLIWSKERMCLLRVILRLQQVINAPYTKNSAHTQHILLTRQLLMADKYFTLHVYNIYTSAGKEFPTEH